jgi:isobutyryl-CoA mutase
MEGSIIPPKRVRYLAEISETINEYNKWAKEQSAIATKLYQLDAVIKMMDDKK